MKTEPAEKQSISNLALISIMRLAGALLLPLLVSMPCKAGEFDFLTDHPGSFSASVTISPGSPQKLLSKGDAATFKRNLEKLRNVLARQPVFNPPQGVEVIGYFRQHDQLPKTNRVPVPGFGYLRFHFYHRDQNSGKAVRICCTTDEMHVIVNDPDQGLDTFGASGFPTKAFYQPHQVGELAGYPVYRMDNGDEVIVLSRTKVPPWVPVTREEYVKAGLASWQKSAAESELDPISPQVARNHQAALAGMSAEELTMQALYYPADPFQPTLAPVGSDEGRPLVRSNPAWFDPKLPRSAVQLLTIRFHYTGNLNHDNPGATEHGDIAPYRVWQALHTSDWAEIGNVVTGK